MEKYRSRIIVIMPPKFANASARTGMMWSDEEDVRLMKAARKGADHATIAREHHRSPAAIKARIIRNVLIRATEEGKPEIDIAEKYNITENDIVEYYRYQEQQQQKQQQYGNVPGTVGIAVTAIPANSEVITLLTEIRDYMRILAEGVDDTM